MFCSLVRQGLTPGAWFGAPVSQAEEPNGGQIWNKEGYLWLCAWFKFASNKLVGDCKVVRRIILTFSCTVHAYHIPTKAHTWFHLRYFPVYKCNLYCLHLRYVPVFKAWRCLLQCLRGSQTSKTDLDKKTTQPIPLPNSVMNERGLVQKTR